MAAVNKTLAQSDKSRTRREATKKRQNAPSGAMQGPRYASYDKLQKAKTITDLMERA
jgi:hypothetical protein